MYTISKDKKINKRRKSIIYIFILIGIMLLVLVTIRTLYIANHTFSESALPDNTEKIFCSPVSDELAVIIDGKLNMYDKEGSLRTYDADYNIEYMSYTDDTALIIDDNSNLYMYSFERGKSSEVVLKDVIYCDISLNSYAAVTKNGELYVWGDNEYKLLGTDKKYVESPEKVKNINDVKKIELDGDYSLALTADGSVYECGLIYYNDSSPIYYSEFAKISELTEISRIYSSGGKRTAVSVDGKVTYWCRKYGCDTMKSIKEDENCKISEISTKNKLSKFSSGGRFIICADEKGNVYLLGEDISLKNNTLGIQNVSSPKKIYRSQKIKSIYAGYSTAFIVRKNKIVVVGA